MFVLDVIEMIRDVRDAFADGSHTAFEGLGVVRQMNGRCRVVRLTRSSTWLGAGGRRGPDAPGFARLVCMYFTGVCGRL